MARRRVQGIGPRDAVKVAVIGGGGFRTPFVWQALADGTGVAVDELVLHDAAPARLELIASVVEGLRLEGGDGPPVRATTALEDAVEGADAVFVAIRVGGLAARVVDERVPLELGVLGQETVGPGGIAFALRTIPVMRSIARVVAERAPAAWFVNFTNPAGLVTEAVRDVLGDRAVGICDSPSALWRHVAQALGHDASSLRPAYAGLNHLGWLTAMRDGGDDVLPSLIDGDDAADVHEIRLAGVDEVRARRAVPNEYLTYLTSTAQVVDALARDGTRAEVLAAQQSRFFDGGGWTPEEALAAWRAAKDARHRTYMAEAPVVSSDRPPDEVDGSTTASADELGYAGVASAFLRAARGDVPERLILGVPNDSRVSWLDDHATVELPCLVDRHGLRADVVTGLGDVERSLAERVREAERLTLAAVGSSSVDRIVAAVAAHPVVPSRELAARIVDGYLARHAWMSERYR